MNLTMKLLALFFGVLMLGNVAYAESPRAQLKQMAEQLQKSPDDNALREQIIKLATTIAPAPALPDEAERRMARGIAAFKAAQSVADYQDAVKEFAQASLIAPWSGDAYYNLGVAQDKAEQYDDALRSLKLALMASPGSKDIKDLTYQVEYRAEQANSPEGKAAKEYGPAQHQFAEVIQNLDGAVFVKDPDASLKEIGVQAQEVRFYKGGRYNLLMCKERDKRSTMDITGQNPEKYEWGEWQPENGKYVMPTYAGGNSLLYFPDNGQVFIVGCIIGRPSTDGRTIDEIGAYTQTLEVRGVWHRQ